MFKAPVVLIPARMASTRLPGKPLADLAGVPMIVQVWRRATEAALGPVFVAAAEPAIVDAVNAAGGEAVLTDPALPSGSDRIFQALQRVDPKGRFDAVINLQGDLPTLDPTCIRAVLAALARPNTDMATLCAEITTESERTDPNVVKAVVAWQDTSSGPATHGPATHGRALYFSRATVPTGAGPHFHHIGIYAYRAAALARFVALPPSPLETRERLEQLRALEAGFAIGIARVDTVPLGVDTPADLARARALLAKGSGSGPAHGAASSSPASAPASRS